MTHTLREAVRSVPKAELHVHLEGALRPSLAVQLADRQGFGLPLAIREAAGSTAGALRAPRFRSFREFVDMYLAISQCFGTASAISEVVEDLARSHVDQGVKYAEVTFTPTTHRRRGVSHDELIAGLIDGRARAKACGVELRWVFDVVRHVVDTGEPTLAFALSMERRDPGSVAGLGLAGPETCPVDPFVDLFARARARGLKALPHAGEQAGPRNVHDAVALLGARRVGHGVRAVEDPAVVALLVEREVVLEVCPSSNVALGVYPSLETHPLPQLMAAGVGIVLASDDPALFGTSALEEYVRCATAFGWSQTQVCQLAERSLTVAYQG